MAFKGRPPKTPEKCQGGIKTAIYEKTAVELDIKIIFSGDNI